MALKRVCDWCSKDPVWEITHPGQTPIDVCLDHREAVFDLINDTTFGGVPTVESRAEGAVIYLRTF